MIASQKSNRVRGGGINSSRSRTLAHPPRPLQVAGHRVVEPAPPSRISPMEKADTGTTKTGPCSPGRSGQFELSPIRVSLSIRFYVPKW